MAYLVFFSFTVFVPRMQLSTFLCQLHGFPMVGFGFTCIERLFLKSTNIQGVAYSCS